MRHHLNAVILATTAMASQEALPDDPAYHAMLYGLIAATPKQGRGLTRVQYMARILVWIEHFNKGLPMLPNGHELLPSLVAAKIEFDKWERELKSV